MLFIKIIENNLNLNKFVNNMAAFLIFWCPNSQAFHE